MVVHWNKSVPCNEKVQRGSKKQKNKKKKKPEEIKTKQQVNIQIKMENPHEQTHNALLSRIINNMVCGHLMNARKQKNRLTNYVK